MAITNEQRIQRANYVGSSDVTAILDHYAPDPGGRRDLYRDITDVANSKLGKDDSRPETDAMRQGTYLEPAMLMWAAARLGLPVADENFAAVWNHAKSATGLAFGQWRASGILASNYDGLSIDPPLVIEAKMVADPRLTGQYGDADRLVKGNFSTRAARVPACVYLQVQHQLLCLPDEYQLAVVVALRMDGRGPGLYAVERNTEVGDVIRNWAETFWQDFVLPYKHKEQT